MGVRVWVRAIDREAIADGFPLMIGAVPFALVTGLAATESEMPTAIAWLTSPLVFAGAAQLTLMSLAGTVTFVAAIAGLVIVNARHIMYSTAMAPAFSRQPSWFRWLGPSLLIDQNFAAASLRFDDEPARFRRYYLTLSLFMYLNWLWLTALGTVIGPAFPESWHLEFAIPLIFLGMTVTSIKRTAHGAAAVAAATVGLVFSGLPDRLGIVCGAIAGIIAGVVADRVWSRS